MGRLAILISFSGAGGVERMVLNLVEEWARLGHQIDLLAIRRESEHLADLPVNVRLVGLRARHSWSAIPEVARYLKRHRPDALLAAKDRAGRAALLARRLSGVPVPLAIRLGTNLSAALSGRGALHRWYRLLPMRLVYRLAESVVAVSQGVADDVVRTTGLPAKRVEVIRNPVITPRLALLAQAPLPHEWLERPRRTPVVLGAGRLTRQKDFATLLGAVAKVKLARPLRLIILGDGRDRAALQDLAARFGIVEDVLLPGFQSNPYAWLARADLFALSSRWEGSPNVLTEALALGVPSVATDCPSGPAETLDGGRLGPLVPVGDTDALASGIMSVLDDPLPSHTLRAGVAGYAAERSAARYLQILGLNGYH